MGDLLAMAYLAAIMVVTPFIVGRMVRIAEADPARLCDRCRDARRSWPPLVLALSRRCVSPSCISRPRGRPG